jgi:hypothetical protein
MGADFAHAKQAADELAADVGPMLHDMPIAETAVPSLGRGFENAFTEPESVHDDSVLAFRTRICSCRKEPDHNGGSRTSNSRN